MYKMLEKKERLFALLFSNAVRKDVITIAWPVLTELLLGSLFGMIDMMMLGRMNDPAVAAASVAAVGITNQPVFIGLSLIQALNVGGTAMVARYLGAKQHERVENTVKHIILLNQLLLALPLSIFAIIFTDSIMAFVGAKADTLAIGRSYFRIIMIGFIFQGFTFALSAALRGAGDTKLPMKVNIRVNLLNVFGNALLIYGLFGFPQLGVTGAAISTAISHVLASIILLRYILKGKSIIKINLSNPFRLNRDIIYNLIKIGVPASIEQLALRIGIFLFVKVVAALGTVTFAAHQICLSILGLSFQPGQAFGIAASSLVGRSLGAKEPDKAQEYARETRKLGSIISSFMAFIFFVFGPQIVGLYTKNPEIIRSASMALKVIALVQPFQSSQFILAGGLRGAGDTVFPLFSTFIGVLGVRVVLSYILVSIMGYGLVGAWMAVFADQLVRWALVYFRFQSGKWKYVTIR
ncbi:MAG: family efflux transporter [Anaerosolibacter sp.]|uniref:MATE family efflux transporter n=1 Tax=Anaerosolibacter sp. TaxID=1872527 RepID=UPI002620931F|nr:MATE family efflux transporter [Anaerosolibacter sp.]MDF2545228.1 family efflux transporter [Anaerosolibacter sp.]